ncbi:hypothetical protein ACROYT_G007782 [Oculina patagonica]
MAARVSDAEFRAAMSVFNLPIPEESPSREVVLFTKTENGKALGTPLSFQFRVTKNLKETKCALRKVLADTMDHCTADEIVLDNVYYVKKQSKTNAVFLIVNESGMQQVFVEYPERMKNGHKSSVPIRMAVDWHFRGLATPTRSSPRGKDSQKLSAQVVAGVNLSSNQADGPVVTIHDLSQDVTLDDLKKHVRMKVPGACIKAGFFWMNAKGKQLYVLNSDQDLSEAKRAKTNSGEQNIIRLAVVVDSDNMRDQKGKKSTKRCLMKNSPSTSKRVKTDIDNDHDDEVYEKFVQGINTDSKNENSKWNEVHIDLHKKLEKIGTLDRFGVVHLSLWTDLIINGTVSGVEEEPDWSKYRHITSVDPLPRKGARLSISRTSASSSQDMLAALILQQEARREDDKKLEAQRRQEQERKWEEKERINREQHLMTMSIISKAFLPGMPSTALHPVKEVVHSEPSTSKETGQFNCYCKNIKPDKIQLRYNTWDPPEYLYNTNSGHEGLSETSSTGSPDKSHDSVNETTVGQNVSSIEQSSSDSDSFDYDEWVSEQIRKCREIENSHDFDAKSDKNLG